MPITNISSSNTFGQFRQAFNDAANAINLLPAVGASLIANSFTANNLTSGRVAIVGSSGIIQDDIGLTYNAATDVLTVAGGVTATNLTSGRVALVGTSGLIQDDAGLTYNTTSDVLTVSGGIITSGITATSVTATNLTSGRVALVGTSGLIQDDAGLTYNPTTDALTVSGALNVSGNLGLGVTLSNWGGSQKALETQAGSLAALSNSLFDLVQNAFNSGSGYIYKTTAPSSVYRQTSGQHQWYTASSGTIGNSITFTQAMTLDGNGYLGIGTTTPGAKLVVSGGSVIISNTSGSSAGIEMAGNGNGVGSTSFFVGQGSDGTAYVSQRANLNLLFGTNNLERMRIDASGVLSISGTTDAANSTSGTLIVSGGVGIAKNLYVSGNTVITGNLTVLGSNSEISTTQININDSLIQLANNNTSDLVDIGVFGQYNSGAANLHSGIFRDSTDGIWKLFKSYNQEPTTKISPSSNNFAYADLNINSLTANSFVYLNNQNVLRFGSSANANYVGLRSNSAVGSNVIWTLPNLDGSANQVLTTNGSGGLSFANNGAITIGKSIAMAIIFGS
jgi:hypothetical protein